MKVEIASLLNADGSVNTRKADRLAMTMANLNNGGKQVTIVSSGAIALGTLRLGLEKQPDRIISKQAIAAVGQAELTKMYKKYFTQYNQIIAQVLLTNDVMLDEERKKNARNTFIQLYKMNIIPIVNENDAVSVEDITLNDNYKLTLHVAQIANADAIVIKGENADYIIVPRGKKYAFKVKEETLSEKIEEYFNLFGDASGTDLFPNTLEEIMKRIDS